MGKADANEPQADGLGYVRFVTWNCNGALRKKWKLLTDLRPDVAVVQECENPKQIDDSAYGSWSAIHLWTGNIKTKGLGVFAFNGTSLHPAERELHPLELFLPCLVNGVWPLLATWTKSAKAPNYSYIGQLWSFLQLHKDFLKSSDALLLGDLNSNKIWDRLHSGRCHSDVVRELEGIGLASCYHKWFSEEQGNETRPTYFQNRKSSMPFHIDHAFAGAAWRVTAVEVGEPDRWLEHSDHMPVVFDLTRVHTSPMSSIPGPRD